MATVTLSQLSRRYGRYVAVDGVNLAVRDGEAMTLLGQAGSGKSTVVRLIAGLVDPSAGSVAVDGRTISSAHGSVPPERRGMGLLFQSIALWPHLSVSENVAFGLSRRGVSAAAASEQVAKCLDLVGLARLGDRKPVQLSLMDRQRAALARALAVQPRVLLLDDALGKLDPADRLTLADEIRRLQRQLGLTLIAATGDPQQAMLLSDRIAAINRGRIEQVDTPGALYMRPETRFVASLLGRAQLIEAQRNGRQIAFSGFTIDAARIEHGQGPGGPVQLCVRPEHLCLMPTAAAIPDGWCARPGTIRQRTFFGNHWDYTVVTASDGDVFGVAAPNTMVFAAGASVQLAIDPSRIVVLR